MQRKSLVLVVLIALLALPVLSLAQDINAFSFNNFSFSLPTSVASNVNVIQVAGDPTTQEQPGGPVPAHAEIDLYNGTAAPQNAYDAIGSISLYHVVDFNGYEFASSELQKLQTLLAQKPDLNTFMVADTGNNSNNLPFMPVANAAQVIRARANYVQGNSLSGVSYVTVYRQDVSPFTADEFTYTFQGLSSDGMYYVSATFKLSTTAFPAQIPANFDMNAFNQNFAQYLTDSIGKLNNAAPTDFTPALPNLDAVFASFAFGAGSSAPGTTQPTAVPPVATVVPPAAVPTVVPTSSDTTMGGLAGATWTLTDLNGQAALPDHPVTLVFSQSGVTGNAGCNSFGGSFQYDSSTSISFSQLIHTLMACTDDAVNTQESAFLDALTKATSYQLSGTQLQITYDGGVLTFTNQ